MAWPSVAAALTGKPAGSREGCDFDRGLVWLRGRCDFDQRPRVLCWTGWCSSAERATRSARPLTVAEGGSLPRRRARGVQAFCDARFACRQAWAGSAAIGVRRAVGWWCAERAAWLAATAVAGGAGGAAWRERPCLLHASRAGKQPARVATGLVAVERAGVGDDEGRAFDARFACRRSGSDARAPCGGARCAGSAWPSAEFGVESHTPSEACAALRAAHLSKAALRGGVKAGWCVRRWWRDVARFRVEVWDQGELGRPSLVAGGSLGLG
jgi:hypothetical protein